MMRAHLLGTLGAFRARAAEAKLVEVARLAIAEGYLDDDGEVVMAESHRKVEQLAWELLREAGYALGLRAVSERDDDALVRLVVDSPELWSVNLQDAGQFSMRQALMMAVALVAEENCSQWFWREAGAPQAELDRRMHTGGAVPDGLILEPVS